MLQNYGHRTRRVDSKEEVETHLESVYKQQNKYTQDG